MIVLTPLTPGPRCAIFFACLLGRLCVAFVLRSIEQLDINITGFEKSKRSEVSWLDARGSGVDNE